MLSGPKAQHALASLKTVGQPVILEAQLGHREGDVQSNEWMMVLC